MLSIFAKITPKSEFFEAAKQAILDIIPRTRQEKGCHVFNLHELDAQGIKYLCLYEIFENQADYDFHHNQEYTKRVFESYQDWLAAPVEIHKLKLIDV